MIQHNFINQMGHIFHYKQNLLHISPTTQVYYPKFILKLLHIQILQYEQIKIEKYIHEYYQHQQKGDFMRIIQKVTHIINQSSQTLNENRRIWNNHGF